MKITTKFKLGEKALYREQEVVVTIIEIIINEEGLKYYAHNKAGGSERHFEESELAKITIHGDKDSTL